MESSFAGRIRQFRSEKGLSQQAFAERCGLTQGNVAHMEGGKEPLQSNVAKLIGGFPDLNPDWLLLGTGSMLRDGKELTPAARAVMPPAVERETLPPGDSPGHLHIVRLTYEELAAENADLHRRLAARTNEVVDMLNDEVKRLRKKPVTSAEAAATRKTIDALAANSPATVYVAPGFKQAVHRKLA